MKNLNKNVTERYGPATAACTPFDTALVESFLCDSQILGRAWLVVLMDVRFHQVLASVLTHTPPSTHSITQLLQDCLRLQSRLPATIIFPAQTLLSKELVMWLAGHQVRIVHPGRSRHSSEVERYFGCLNFHLTTAMASTKAKTLDLASFQSSVEKYIRDFNDQPVGDGHQSRREAYLASAATTGRP